MKKLIVLLMVSVFLQINIQMQLQAANSSKDAKNVINAFIKVEGLYTSLIWAIAINDDNDKLSEYSDALKTIEKLTEYIGDYILILKTDSKYDIAYIYLQDAANHLKLSVRNLRSAIDSENEQYIDLATNEFEKYSEALASGIILLPKRTINTGSFLGSSKSNNEVILNVALYDENYDLISDYINNNDYKIVFDNSNYSAEVIDVISDPVLDNEISVIFLMMDASGSLSSSDPNNTRVTAAKLMTDYLNDDDIIFLSYFGNTNEYPYLELQGEGAYSGSSKYEIKSEIDKFRYMNKGNHTPLWVSTFISTVFMKEAINKMSINPSYSDYIFTPSVFLFTDGENNFDPTGMSTEDKKEIDNTFTPEMVTLSANYLNIPIYSIGLSDNVETNTLNNVSFNTWGMSGTSKNTSGLSDLFNNFSKSSLQGSTRIKVKLNATYAHGNFKIYIGDTGKYITGSI